MRPPQRHPCPVRARKTRTTKSVGSAVAKVSGELVLHAMDSTCYHALVVVTHALSPFDRTHCRRPLFYPCGCTGSVKYTPQGWYVVAQPRRPLSCTSAQRPMQAPRSSRWRVAPGTDHHPPFLLLRVFAASRPGSSTARRNTASSALTSSSSSRSVMTTCRPSSRCRTFSGVYPCIHDHIESGSRLVTVAICWGKQQPAAVTAMSECGHCDGHPPH